MIKNTAGQKIGAQLVTASDGSAFTGSVTVSVTVDAGTQATGSVGSGACTHEGNGYHTYAPAQAETNGTLIAFTFTGTGAVPATVQVFTTGFDVTAAQWPANTTHFAGQTVTAAAGVTLPSSVASPTNITAASGVVLSSAGVQAIWDALMTALTTVGSVGKLLADNLNATVSSRLASASYTAPDNATITNIYSAVDTEVAAVLAAVDTEVAAILALLDDPRAEPGQGTPAVNADAVTKIDYLYKAFRNKITQDATTLKIYADDATTVDHKATVSDDGTTFTRGEIATGP